MPFVELLEKDRCQGNSADLQSIQNPTWDDVQDAINRLDGAVFTTVCVSGEEGNRSLFVGGGNFGYYNVFIAVGIDQEFHNLLNTHKQPVDHRILVTGGQPGRFDSQLCVDRTTALIAAQHFFETGQPHRNLTWQSG